MDPVIPALAPSSQKADPSPDLSRSRWIPIAARTRIAFLIPSLVAHGAERQLCELVRGLDHSRFETHVLVFYGPGDREGTSLWSETATIPEVTWHCLHKRKGVLGHLQSLPRLFTLLRRIHPDLLHGYMDANLHALLMGRLLRRPVVWGIRRASRDLSQLDRPSRWLLQASAGLSRFADLVIFNSEAGRSNYQEMGFRPRRMLVIPNGFDIERFAPDPSRGREQRRAWGIPVDAPLVGIVGRLDPIKDHPTFLRAAARLSRKWETARFVCVGEGPSGNTEALKRLAASLGIADRVLWPGTCGDMTSVYNALTLLVLSSTDEGFPNVLGEAMACGIPCVSTRVGDAAHVLGDTGLLVAPGDDADLAAAVSHLLGESPEGHAARSRACRSRVCAAFNTQALALHTGQALLSLLSVPPTPPFPVGG